MRQTEEKRLRKLYALADGELSPNERKKLAQKTAKDPEARELQRQILLLDRQLRQAAQEEYQLAPQAIRQAMAAAGRSTRRRLMAALAGLGLLFAAGLWLTMQLLLPPTVALFSSLLSKFKFFGTLLKGAGLAFISVSKPLIGLVPQFITLALGLSLLALVIYLTFYLAKPILQENPFNGGNR